MKRSELVDSRRNTVASVVWHLSGVLVVLSVPSLAWLSTPAWRLPLDLLAQPLWLALGYVVAAYAGRAGGGSTWRRLMISAVTLGVFVGFAASIQLIRSDVSFSRPIAAISLGLALGLLVLGRILQGRARAAVLGTVIVSTVSASGGAEFLRARRTPGPQEPSSDTVLFSSHYLLKIKVRDGLVAQEDVQRGGGITRAGDRFVAVTGAGAFYVVTWTKKTESVEGRRLPLPSPSNAREFDADVASDVDREGFRVHDVAARRTADGWQLFASHHLWDRENRCVNVAVSKATLDEGLTTVKRMWTSVFQTRPCLPVDADARGLPFLGLDSGGRLAWLKENRLVLTVGDHAFDGWNRPVAAAQVPENDYGKTLLIDTESGRSERFTLGHRNAQGLYVDPQGRVWSTEHGPKGGDELNLLVAGKNYGWPYETYGTDYSRLTWPLADGRPPVSSFERPIFAWVPSIGVTSLIGVASDELPRWKGNLLVASLKAQTVFRLVLADGHVAYAEPIPVGRRVRDLVEGEDGVILLWDDLGTVTSLSVPRDVSRGEAAFSACGGCHIVNGYEGSGGLGPNLFGVLGKPVASRTDYNYSEALRSAGGNWTPDRLDAFLANPASYAPGSTMSFRVPDPQDRAAIIAFLSKLPSQSPGQVGR